MNNRYRLRATMVLLGLFAITTFITLIKPAPAQANTIYVVNNKDIPLPSGCNLRQAIANHNANGQPNLGCTGGGGGPDTIILDTNSDVALGSSLPAISGNLTIAGCDDKSDNCDNQACSIVLGGYLTVSPGAFLTLSGVSISNGADLFPFTQDLSIIDNNGGTVTIDEGRSLTNCLFSNNKKNPPEFGGVIYNRGQGRVFIRHADLEGSSATSAGGAIYNRSGSILLVGPTNILQNNAPNGGGIYNGTHGSIQLVNQGNHVVIAENSASSFGGGILNAGGNVEIKSSNFSISSNSAGVGGGGIYSQNGTLEISRGSGPVQDIAIASNQTAGIGGGIFDDSSQMSISGMEIKGNLTSNGGAGAGVYVVNDNAQITQTYFHDNNAAGLGSAIASPDDSTLTVIASTFAGDNGLVGIDLDGAGKFLALNSTFMEPLNIANSQSRRAQIVSSTFDRADLSGIMTVRSSVFQDGNCTDVVDSRFNLQFGSSNCPTSIPRADPIFDPLGLQFNGGPTPTIGILRGSAAINAVPLTACTDQNGKPLKVDQRGFVRPASRQTACDIGAFEFQARQTNH